jgi:hypothetical protein
MEQKKHEITKSSRKRRQKKVLKTTKRSANDDTDGLPIDQAIDDEDYDELMNPKKNQTRYFGRVFVSYNGVTKSNKRRGNRGCIASIKIDGQQKYLGVYDTPKDAALAFDRAVIHHKLSLSQLNFPSTVAKNKKKKQKQDNSQASGPRKTSKRTIQSGKNTTNNTGKWSTQKKKKQDNSQASGPRKTSKKTIQSGQSTTNNTGKWSTQEQALFDKGYKKWGPNWKKIADMVKTRNNKQVCSRSLVVLVQVVQVPPVPKVQ